MSYCDILLIQRGYQRRNILQYQLQRLQAYGAFFSMSGTQKTPQEWLPLYVDDIMQCEEETLTTEEMEALINEIQSYRMKKSTP